MVTDILSLVVASIEYTVMLSTEHSKYQRNAKYVAKNKACLVMQY